MEAASGAKHPVLKVEPRKMHGSLTDWLWVLVWLCIHYTCFMFDSCDKLCVCACVCMHLRVNLYCWTVVAHRCKVFMCDWKNRDSSNSHVKVCFWLSCMKRSIGVYVNWMKQLEDWTYMFMHLGTHFQLLASYFCHLRPPISQCFKPTMWWSVDWGWELSHLIAVDWWWRWYCAMCNLVYQFKLSVRVHCCCTKEGLQKEVRATRDPNTLKNTLTF